MTPARRAEDITWKDLLGRDYDFILEPFAEDPGPREVILPFNPGNVERLRVKKGDVLFGRPASVGGPVTHVGVVVEEADYFNQRRRHVVCRRSAAGARARHRDRPVQSRRLRGHGAPQPRGA